MDPKKNLVSRARKVAPSQIDTMLHFMEQHAQFLGPGARLDKLKHDQLWWRLTTLLNTDPSTVRKTPEQWKTVWRDLRYKATAKSFDRQRNPNETPPFTPLERKILKIMGHELSENEVEDCKEGNEGNSNSEYYVAKAKCKRSRSRRTDEFQYKRLLDFMEQQPDFARGLLPRQKNERTWRRLTNILNAQGSQKTLLQWRTVWRDLKCSTMRVKLRNISRLGNKERRVLAIIETESMTTDTTKLDDYNTIDSKRNIIMLPNHEDSDNANCINEAYIEQSDSSPEVNSTYETKADSSTPFLSFTDENLVSMLPALQSQKVLDEDEVFLLSILPAIKRMTEDEKYEFRADVMNLIRVMRKKRE